MKGTENKTEGELAAHIEKLIAGVHGTKIPAAWFEFKQDQTLGREIPMKRMDSALGHAPSSVRLYRELNTP